MVEPAAIGRRARRRDGRRLLTAIGQTAGVPRRVRPAIPVFVVAVKLSSADFQRGGFEPDDAVQVARRLQDEGVDKLEISGGTYEWPGFMGLGRQGAD